jgi:hypothetical protein
VTTAVALFIGSSAWNFDAPLMWTLVTVVASAYVLSRGLAKSGARYLDQDPPSLGGNMPLLWILVILLVILAIAGGTTLSNFLWLLLAFAVIVALVSMFAY